MTDSFPITKNKSCLIFITFVFQKVTFSLFGKQDFVTELFMSFTSLLMHSQKQAVLSTLFTYIHHGDPNQNCRFLRAITLKLCISDPILVKRKVVHFFLSSKNCLHFSVACLQEKSTTSETHFGFTNMVSEVHSF